MNDSMVTELDVRKAICEVGRRMYAKNLVAASDGNISVRLSADRYLCTPSGVSKGFMKPGELIIADGNAKKIAGEGKVTSEFFTHLAAYEERPDINAVVHAHPPTAIGFTLAGLSLSDCVLPEVVASVGGIPTTAYATPASKEGAEVIRPLIRQCDALMLDRHGAITVGRDVFDAYFKMEKIEHAAETMLVAHTLGNVQTLDREQVAKLYTIREEYGATGKAFRCTSCGCVAEGEETRVSDSDGLDRVIEETLRVLGETG